MEHASLFCLSIFSIVKILLWLEFPIQNLITFLIKVNLRYSGEILEILFSYFSCLNTPEHQIKFIQDYTDISGKFHKALFDLQILFPAH